MPVPVIHISISIVAKVSFKTKLLKLKHTTFHVLPQQGQTTCVRKQLKSPRRYRFQSVKWIVRSETFSELEKITGEKPSFEVGGDVFV